MREPVAVDATVASRIIEMRGHKVLLDSDLAVIYGVETRDAQPGRATQQRPLPGGLRVPAGPGGGSGFDITNCDLKERAGRKAAASILNSPRAVEMIVFRAFVRLLDAARGHVELARQLALLERRVTGHDSELKQVFTALRLLLQPHHPPRRPIGFTRDPRPSK